MRLHCINCCIRCEMTPSCTVVEHKSPNQWMDWKCHGNSSSILLTSLLFCLWSLWLISSLEPAEYPPEIVTSEGLLTHQWNTFFHQDACCHSLCDQDIQYFSSVSLASTYTSSAAKVLVWHQIMICFLKRLSCHNWAVAFSECVLE